MKRVVREWIDKAEEDLRAAEVLTSSPHPLHDQICFFCQQSAEKFLKALLEDRGDHIERTHDLDRLLSQLLPHYPGLKSLRRGLVFLTNFAVATRYPGDHATRRQVIAAQRWATRVQAECLAILRPPTSRKPRPSPRPNSP